MTGAAPVGSAEAGTPSTISPPARRARWSPRLAGSPKHRPGAPSPRTSPKRIRRPMEYSAALILNVAVNMFPVPGTPGEGMLYRTRITKALDPFPLPNHVQGVMKRITDVANSDTARCEWRSYEDLSDSLFGPKKCAACAGVGLGCDACGGSGKQRLSRRQAITITATLESYEVIDTEVRLHPKLGNLPCGFRLQIPPLLYAAAERYAAEHPEELAALAAERENRGRRADDKKPPASIRNPAPARDPEEDVLGRLAAEADEEHGAGAEELAEIAAARADLEAAARARQKEEKKLLEELQAPGAPPPAPLWTMDEMVTALAQPVSFADLTARWPGGDADLAAALTELRDQGTVQEVAEGVWQAVEARVFEAELVSPLAVRPVDDAPPVVELPARAQPPGLLLFTVAMERVRELSPGAFDQWFAAVQFDGLEEGVLSLRASNEFVLEWVKANFVPTFLEQLGPVQVVWKVDPQLTAPIVQGPPPPPIVQGPPPRSPPEPRRPYFALPPEPRPASEDPAVVAGAILELLRSREAFRALPEALEVHARIWAADLVSKEQGEGIPLRQVLVGLWECSTKPGKTGDELVGFAVGCCRRSSSGLPKLVRKILRCAELGVTAASLPGARGPPSA